MAEQHHREAVQRIRGEEREAECVLLFTIGGLNLDEIAEKVGYTHRSAAKKAIDRAMKRRYAETTEHRDVLIQRHIEITRQMIRGLAPKIVKGDARSIEIGVRVLEREARLLGLDAPVKADIKITEALQAEINDLMESMASLDAVEAAQLLARERG